MRYKSQIDKAIELLSRCSVVVKDESLKADIKAFIDDHQYEHKLMELPNESEEGHPLKHWQE